MDRQSLPKKKKRYALSKGHLDQLLHALNSDPIVAAEQYEQIRLALTTYFTFRGAPDPLELCDEVFDRAMRRLSEGAGIFVEQPMAYFYGIARNVWREVLAKPPAALSIEEDFLPEAGHANNPFTLLMVAEEQAELEERVKNLEHCLQQLSAKDSELILAYYNDFDQAKIEHRQILAARFNITMKTLRNKTTLLRAKLAECMKKQSYLRNTF